MKRKLLLGVVVTFLLAAIALGMVQPTQAAEPDYYYIMTGTTATCNDAGGGNVQIASGQVNRVAYVPADNSITVHYTNILGATQTTFSIPEQGPGATGTLAPRLSNPGAPPVSMSWLAVLKVEGSEVGSSTLTITCSGIGATPSISTSNTYGKAGLPPGLWLAHVCEPYDGFSGDGWMTWDSDAAQKTYGTQLYVAASQDGPWYAVEANGPPYVFNQATLEALADMVGADSYLNMWFKVSEMGKAVLVSSAMADREAQMDAICGG